MKNKTCTKCNIKKLITEFNKDKSHKDGLSSQCKFCRKLTNRVYFCKDCGKEICVTNGVRGKGRCQSCANTLTMKKLHPLKHKIIGGYFYIKAPKNHPFPNKCGYILEHRLVMEKKLNRYLNSKELVHHINGIRDDNRVENLTIVNCHNHEANTFAKILQQRIRELERLLNEK